MKKSYFYGIRGIEFIWRGPWVDPEIKWHGKSFNYYAVESALFEIFKEEHNDENFFEPWVKKNAPFVREILQMLAENKCFYGGNYNV